VNKIIFSLAILMFSSASFAGIFGPSNYSECVKSLTTSSKNLDYGQVRRICYSDFPVLTNLSKNKNAHLTCIGSINTDRNEIFKMYVRPKVVQVINPKGQLGQSPVDFLISAWTKKNLVFYIVKTNGNVETTFTGNLDIEDGSLNITDKTAGKKQMIWFYQCTENDG